MLIYMSEFFKSSLGDCKPIIDYKITKLKKSLEELQTILLNTEDDYAREYTVIFNTLLSKCIKSFTKPSKLIN